MIRVWRTHRELGAHACSELRFPSLLLLSTLLLLASDLFDFQLLDDGSAEFALDFEICRIVENHIDSDLDEEHEPVE